MNKNEKVLHAMNNVDDRYITEKTKTASSKDFTRRRLMPAVACLALTVTLGAGVISMNFNQPIPDTNPLIAGGISEGTSPSEANRFLNYNGLRYTYVKNAIPEELIQLDRELATITADLYQDPVGLATEDLAGTFSVGAKIYSLVGDSVGFRLAVSDETGLYVCQITDSVPSGSLNLSAMFEDIDLVNEIQYIGLLDHSAELFLGEIDRTKSQALIGEISTSEKAQLKSTDYEHIAAAQADGRSVTVECKLSDGTMFTFYTIVDMGLVIVGDNTYNLSDAAQGMLQQALAD